VDGLSADFFDGTSRVGAIANYNCVSKKNADGWQVEAQGQQN
jgi:hypothetical protein